MFRWLKQYHGGNNGIILLQETHSTPDCEKLWKNEWGSNIIFSHGASNSRGVAILFPRHIDYTIVNSILHEHGRYIILELEIIGTQICLLNLYAPTMDSEKEQINLIDEIMAIMESYNEGSLICGGDFNVCLHPELDKYGTDKKLRTNYSKKIFTFCEMFNLCDIWRVFNPTSKRYTWRQLNPLRQSRLDFWLVSIHIMYELENVDIKPSYKSDHSIICLVIVNSKEQERGPGFWKFNSSLLTDTVYVAYI